MSSDDEIGDYHTLGGFVMARLHRIPVVGSRITAEGVQYEVIGMDGRRVDRVLITPPKAVTNAAREG